MSTAMEIKKDNIKERKASQCQKKYRQRVSWLRTTKFSSGFIDTHCHLDFLIKSDPLIQNLEKYINENADPYPASYEGCVTVFCYPPNFKRITWWNNILSQTNVFGAFGCHPHFANLFGEAEESWLDFAVRHDRVKAVGEMGLDYSYKNNVDHEVQKEVFIKQLNLAVQVEKPIVIHCRDAKDDCLEILRRHIPANTVIHRHCFTGDIKEALEWLDTFPNLYIGFTNSITGDDIKAEPSRKVAAEIPLERILLETDAPYFRPRLLEKTANDNRSNPGMAIFVANAIARLRMIRVEDVLKITRRNARNVYSV